MAEHLNVHPRAIDAGEPLLPAAAGRRSSRCSHYTAPDQHAAMPRNSDIGGHHVALYVDDLDAAVAELRGRGVTVFGEPTASKARPRASAGSTSSPRGECSSSWCRYPNGKAWDIAHAAEKAWDRDVTADGDRHAGGEPPRRGLPARRDPARRDRPGRADPAGGDRRSAWARAGCRCARRCGCWRPRGWPSTRPTRAPGCRGWAGTRSTSMYRMREQLEPLALAESLPQLDDAERRPAGRDPGRIESDDGPDRVPRRSTASSTCGTLRRMRDRAAERDGRAGCGTPPSTTGARS